MTDAPPQLTVYWRPGCSLCSSLLRQLDRRGIPHRRVNIWDDPGAAARVRTITGGDETVPTVEVGEVALVNPSADQVLATASTYAPELLPAGYVAPEPGRLARWMSRLGA